MTERQLQAAILIAGFAIMGAVIRALGPSYITTGGVGLFAFMLGASSRDIARRLLQK